jgi:hypothetical protein
MRSSKKKPFCHPIEHQAVMHNSHSADASTVALHTSAESESRACMCRMMAVIIALITAITAAATVYEPLGAFISQCLSGSREFLQAAPAFIESLSLIFMSELGDKTFFIAALLAIRFNRAIAFFGSVLSLGLMTVISVGIGRVFVQIPQFVDQGANYGQYIGAALLVYFGAVPPPVSLWLTCCCLSLLIAL